MAPSIDRDRGDDDHARHDFLNPVRKPHLGSARADNRHDEGADERAGDGSLSPRQASTSDDNRSNHIELEPYRNGGVPNREARELKNTREACERARQSVDSDLDPLDMNTAKSRCLLVRADREYVRAEPRVA